MSILLSFLLLFHPSWDTDPDLWGIGLISFSAEVSYFGDPFHLPRDQKLAYFDSPNGAYAGYLIFQQHDHQSELSISPLSEERQIATWEDSRETDYEVRSLLVFERRDNWVKVLHHTTKGGKWLNLEALKAHNLYYRDWLQYLTDHPTTFSPPQDFGLNLRKGAGVSYQKLESLKGDSYSIQLSGKTTLGTWAEVKVIKYDGYPCEDRAEIASWTGWIKVLDDKGFPNIWYYTRGC